MILSYIEIAQPPERVLGEVAALRLQWRQVDMRLGISDGTNTELIAPEVQEGTLMATGVTGLGTTRTAPTQTGSGNPLMPGGRGPGGGQGGRGR